MVWFCVGDVVFGVFGCDSVRFGFGGIEVYGGSCIAG